MRARCDLCEEVDFDTFSEECFCVRNGDFYAHLCPDCFIKLAQKFKETRDKEKEEK